MKWKKETQQGQDPPIRKLIYSLCLDEPGGLGQATQDLLIMVEKPTVKNNCAHSAGSLVLPQGAVGATQTTEGPHTPVLQACDRDPR